MSSIDTSTDEHTHGVVTLSVANLHESPKLSAPLVSQLLMGTTVTILRAQDRWLYVHGPDKYPGWTVQSVQRMNSVEIDSWQCRRKVIVTAAHAYVRRSRVLDSGVISDVVAGDILALAGDAPTPSEAGSCHPVAFPDGRTGFLDRTCGEPLSAWLGTAHATPDTIVATAQRFMGTPYLWGGASTKALDCSGFVKTVFFLNGMILPRDAVQQALVGKHVPIDETMAQVRPGDLLFFAPKADVTASPRIAHVGISLGGARFIQASGYVRVSSLSPADPDYATDRAEALVSVRRVLGSEGTVGITPMRLLPEYGG